MIGLSREIHVPANRIGSFVARGTCDQRRDGAALARYFGTTAEYWLNLQARYDLETARDRWEERVKADVRPRSAA